MITVFVDGISALTDHTQVAVSLLFLVTWGGLIIRAALEKLLPEQLAQAEYISLAIGGWWLPALILAGGIVWFGPPVGIIIVLLGLTFALITLRSKRIHISQPALALIFLFAFSIILRFAFLEKALLPAYFDSAEHYRIIKSMLAGESATQNGSYYHNGYHLLIAAATRLFQLRITDVMLVFGQLALAALPFSIFIIIRQETNSDAAGIFSVLLAGVGFHMPAHLVNWGKYPALFGLACIAFTFSLAYLFIRNLRSEKRAAFFTLLVIAIIASAAIHTRAPVVYALAAAAFSLTVGWRRLPQAYQSATFFFTLLLTAAELFAAYQDPALSPLFIGYTQDVWVLAFVLLAFPFAARTFPELSFFTLALTCLMLLALFIPIALPAYGTLALLDRPFVQALTFLPLALIGGLGLAGMLRLFPTPSLPAQLVTLTTFGLLLLNTSLHHKFYPSECCQLAGRDDLAVLAWLANETPQDANILIAASEFYISSHEPDTGLAGSDAGIWIPALTARRATLFHYQSEFGTAQTHEKICAQSAEFIYVGGLGQHFDSAQLASRPDWYLPALTLPGAQVYQVNCP